MTDQLLQVLIAEDHPICREGLRAQLDAAAGIELVLGGCASGARRLR